MTALQQVSRNTHSKWPAIERARQRAREEKAKLEGLLRRFGTEDANIVVFGSLARNEWTSKSDLDWNLLIDGQANPLHLPISLSIKKVLERGQYAQPGTTGTFGNMAFSHDIIHRIGGELDTNRNTTQRILLLLESAPIGRREAYDAVIKKILARYLELGVSAKPRRYPHFPRFLLNDIVRYWRTMAVDFAGKQWERGGKGWGLRNIKLRISRKLTFVSGLLICLSCLEMKLTREEMQEHLRRSFGSDPLENLAASVLRYSVPSRIARKLFSSYDRFLACLDDEKRRIELGDLTAEKAELSKTFNRMREVSDEFEEALIKVFFSTNARLTDNAKRFAIF